MLINVINQQNDLPISTEQVQKLVLEVIQFEGQACDEVAVHFVDTLTISQLHGQFFNDPSPTDCISFPIDEEESEQDHFRLLGEIFICPATAIEFAKQHQENVHREVTLYIVHSLLHLMGYDDIDESDILEMRQAENRHMTQLEKQGLYLTSD